METQGRGGGISGASRAQQPSSGGQVLSVSGSPWRAAIVAAGCWVPLWAEPLQGIPAAPQPILSSLSSLEASLALPTPE